MLNSPTNRKTKSSHKCLTVLSNTRAANTVICTVMVTACVLLQGTFPTTVTACSRRCSKIVTFYFGVETPVPNPDHPYLVDIFHTDLDVPFLGNVWHAYVSHDDVPGGSSIPPDQALIYANEHAQTQLASIPPSYAFIGAEPNETFWILPQTPDPNILYLGFAAETMTPADHARLCTWNPGDPGRGANVEAKWIQINLIGMRGPPEGEFSVWQQSVASPPLMMFSTFEGGITEAGDVYYILSGGHAHMNWAFTQPGIYEVDLQISSYTNNIAGDIDDDMDVDGVDLQILVDVLLEYDTTIEYIAAADLNCDGRVNGLDIQPFVDAFIGL